MAYFHCPKPELRTPAGRKLRKGYQGEVQFPTSYSYNGGIVIGEEWYDGYEVPPPNVPEGYELIGLGVGLQLNCRPPVATRYLRAIKLRAHTRQEAKEGGGIYTLTRGKETFRVYLKKGHLVWSGSENFTDAEIKAAIKEWYGKEDLTPRQKKLKQQK